MNWQPIETAPRDGRYVLAIVAENDSRHMEHLAGRPFVIRHEGRTPSDFDMGWAVYPGYGGASDHMFSHWMPLPPPPAIADQSPEGEKPQALSAQHAGGGGEANRPNSIGETT